MPSPDAVSTDVCSEDLLALGTACIPAVAAGSETADVVAPSLSHRDLSQTAHLSPCCFTVECSSILLEQTQWPTDGPLTKSLCPE